MEIDDTFQHSANELKIDQLVVKQVGCGPLFFIHRLSFRLLAKLMNCWLHTQLDLEGMRSVLQQECLVLYSLPHLAFLAIFCYHKVHWQKTAFCDGRGARDGSLTWPMQFNMTVIILAFTLTLSGVCKVHPAKGELQLNPISENVYHHQRHSIQLSLHSF